MIPTTFPSRTLLLTLFLLSLISPPKQRQLGRPPTLYATRVNFRQYTSNPQVHMSAYDANICNIHLSFTYIYNIISISEKSKINDEV